jgi:DNA-binding LytR/AlgR family response regulator
MRMGDAVAAAGDVPGFQIHRSWWVARAAVERFERDGRKGRITLCNGLVVPVSRDRLADLPVSGWPVPGA